MLVKDTILYRILPRVSKPARYLGNELNAVKKEWKEEFLKTALIFPDLYEVAHSGLTIPLLYHLINSQPQFLAERCFAPWPDLEAELRKNRLPLFSLESTKPLSEFDLLAFSLSYELVYTNLLNILELSGLPLYAKDRDESFPLVIGGGSCAFNPEPVADFFDLFFLGEAEDALPELLAEFLKWKKAGKKDKAGFLKELGSFPGIYIPSLYLPEYQPDGRIASLSPQSPQLPAVIKKQVVKDLNRSFYPLAPILPYLEIVHDRLMLELFRGCTRGCRFCQAGMLYRPVREREPEQLLSYARTMLKNTGYEQISLASLSSTDYHGIAPLLNSLSRDFKNSYLEITLPSLRIDAYSLKLAGSLKSRASSGGLTFAPEAASQQLRDLINKNTSRDDLFNTLKEASEAGWKKLKLYFMLGLPGETPEDIKAIAELLSEITKNFPLNFNVSLSPFVPKPHTPFQWEKMEEMESLEEKARTVKRNARGRRLKISWHAPQMSFIEGVFSRGDRRLAEVLKTAYQSGCRFDAWSEWFDFARWQKVFAQCRIDPQFYTRQREPEEILPWQHLGGELQKEFLLKEREKALKGEITPDCREFSCQECGVCPALKVELKISPESKTPALPPLPPAQAWVSPPPVLKIRFQYQKGWELRFISHLDLVRSLERAVRRAELPAAYSRGFHPRMKLAPAIPLQVGIASSTEWADLEFYSLISPLEFKEKLNQTLPPGLKIIKAREVPLFAPSLFSSLGLSVFKVHIKAPNEKLETLKNQSSLLKKLKEIPVERKNKPLDIKPFLYNIQVASAKAGEIILEISLRHTLKGGGRLDEILRLLLKDDDDYQVLFQERIGLFTRAGSRWINP